MTDANDQILRVFMQEGADQIETLNGLLLRLESSPQDGDLLAQIMRVAHNLKGASGTAGLGAISEAAHKVEEVIQRLRAQSLAPTSALFDVLFKTMDAVEASLEEVGKGRDESVALGSALGDIEQFLAARHAEREKDSASGSTSSSFVLGEYDHIRIRVLKQRGRRLLRVDLAIPGAERAPSEWAQRTLRLLRQSCDIVATIPPEVGLQAVERTRRLSALCGTTLTAPELRSLLGQAKPESCEIADTESTAPALAGQEVVHTKMHDSVKVDLARVDGLVDMIGELVIVQSMVANAPEILSLSSRSIHNYLGQLTRITRDLQDAGLRLRMVPLRGIFQIMARTARDLARKHDKAVDFTTAGEDVEMDRSVVERITDPLVHLVRNAVDHGVEAAEQRELQGKPRTATVALSAYHQGGNIVVEIRDDGRGLDREQILQKARETGLVRHGATLSDGEILNLIFENGFSTADKVTDTSGRGVGLDIVRRNVEAMRGRVTVLSEPGKATTFRLILPLTLAIIDGMLIACGSERYIIPTIAILESIRPKPAAVLSVAGRWQMLNMRGAMLPLIPLGRLFGIETGCMDAAKGLVVVVEGIGRRVGLVVDDVISQQQVVIKNLGSGLGSAQYLSGAAILPDGMVGLILNIDEIANAAFGFDRAPGAPSRDADAVQPQAT